MKTIVVSGASSFTNFVDRALAEVAQDHRERVAEMEKQLQVIEQNLADLRQGVKDRRRC